MLGNIIQYTVVGTGCLPIQVTSHFYWEKEPLINTELYPTPLQIINYSSALLLSVPIILCKKTFMSQPFVNRLATMGRRWAWYEKCRTGKGIQHNDTYNFYKAMLHIYIYRLRFHSSVQMKSKMCSEL